MSICIRVRRADGATSSVCVDNGTTVNQLLNQIGLAGQALSFRFRSDTEDSKYERVEDSHQLTEDGILALAPVAKSQG